MRTLLDFPAKIVQNRYYDSLDVNKGYEHQNGTELFTVKPIWAHNQMDINQP